MSHFQSLLVFLARLLIAPIFLVDAYERITDWDQAGQSLQALGVPSPEAFLPVSVGLMILGGLSILIGFRARFGAFLLMVYLVPMLCYLHPFWTGDEAQYQEQMLGFVRDAGPLGGLLMIAAFGAGRLALSGRKGKAELDLDD